MTMKGVKEFFDARTIAVVGASRDENKVGHIIFKNLLACKHTQAFPVNPNATKILGQRAFRDILEIPYFLDCIVIAVKAELVPEVMKQAAKKKVKSAVVVSAGFSETGNFVLEQEINKIADSAGILLLGPNVLGFINPYKEMNASFFNGIPEKGKIAFLSQSGAIGAAVLDAVHGKFGFSGFVSLGNSIQLDFSDFIEYYSDDKNTEIIALYIESLREGKGKRFIEVCKKAGKIIIALKAGKSMQGQRAALSHTAALASEPEVYKGIFRQAGILEVESVSELFNVAELYAKYGKIGKKACILTNGGGLGVLCADACQENGIELPKLTKESVERLNKILPDRWNHANPADILGDALAPRYEQTLSVLDETDFFDFFIVLLTPQYMTQPLETAEVLIKLKKPVFACFMGGNKVESARRLLKGRIPIFNDVFELGRVVGKLVSLAK